MRRRRFLKQGMTAALVARPIGTNVTDFVLASTEGPTFKATPVVLKTYTSEEHRRRLQNIAECQKSVRHCLHRHLITDYLPGQCSYNLGEYPCRRPWVVDEWDAQELDRLKDQGIGLIQLHEEWNDSQRMFGGHKFAPLN